jgi:hypothetical protein
MATHSIVLLEQEIFRYGYTGMAMSRPRRPTWAENARYWKTVPRKSNIILMTGIFCLFAAFGLVMSLLNASWRYPEWAMAIALLTAAFSVGYAHAGFRRVIWLIPTLLIVQFFLIWLVDRYMVHNVHDIPPSEWTAHFVNSRLEREGLILMAFIILGYSCVVHFIRKEGQRVFAPLAEVQLAREVHQNLVPEISRTIGPYEIYGISIPSGQVGGDLVDVTQNGQRSIAYVADVSGHGVPAGMIMAMVKSAAHMAFTENASMQDMLMQINRVLQQLLTANAFVTFACLGIRSGSELEFALAGHTPILRYSRRAHAVEELSGANPPLAIFPETSFSVGSVLCSEGDILAVITDGLSESSDRKGAELGLDPLKSILLASSTLPLSAVAEALRAAALRHGPQMDDQTILLLRRGPLT